MKRKTLIVCCVCILNFLSTARAEDDLSEGQPLASFLDKYGFVNRFTFTLETLGNDDAGIANDAIAIVESTDKPAYLQQRLNGFVVLPSVLDSRCYHIIDKKLSGLSNYVLDQRIENFTFEGDLLHFVRGLATIKPELGPPTWYSGAVVRDDKSTLVTLSGVSGTLRDVLTPKLPADYDPLRWICRTNLGQHPASEITFRGRVIND